MTWFPAYPIGKMTMMFRGIKLIRPIEVDMPGTSKKQLLFDNILDHFTRDTWLAAGYPIFYDQLANKSYILLDRNARLEETEQVDVKCECGAVAVNASKHSYYCPRA